MTLCITSDAGETVDAAETHPEKVAELQKRVSSLSQQAVPPLSLQSALGASKRVLFGSVALPEDDQEFNLQP